MIFSKHFKILTIVFLVLIPIIAFGFGKNKVQYHPFEWHYLQSEHFDVYFYPGAYDIAAFTANEAESSYVQLRGDFKYEITERVRIILYKSHNDFQQTNVVDVYLPEGVGGVTELYKNRVVIPFEGSFAQLRHVLHHELVHAVMNDMLYGGSVQSLISGQVVPVPLWFSEGLAEYFSLRWDTRADMIIRDATISGYLPPIQYLDYYLAYQGGQSVFRYIAQKYGHEKISEILHKVKSSYRFESALKSALGLELKELSENWQKQMRKEYWPDIADRKETAEIARAHTDHKEEQNYLNISPALSPNGDKLIFLSDMKGKKSIYLLDILENKVVKRLIKGETSVNFEELHWLSPGMDWSPDGKKVTFAAKAGDQDALYIYDIDSDEVEQYKFDLDGLFSTSWSPKGDEIAFIGNLNGASDIYIFDIKNKKITNITNDVFSDSYPRWSGDGKRLVFVSDRGAYVNPDMIPENFRMSTHNYDNTDIYLINSDGSGLERITRTEARESEPVWSPDGEKLLYVSDVSGVYNIYKHDLESDSSYAVTNLLTGAFQLNLDRDGKTLAFSSFYEGGWDIFTIKNPFDLEPVKVDKTEYLKRLETYPEQPIEDEPVLAEADTTVDEQVSVPKTTDYSRFVFADLDRRTTRKKVEVELDEDEYKMDDGHYKVRNYKVKFTPDLINGAAQYNTLWGFQAFTQLAFSDILGNHKIYIGSNLVFSLNDSYLTFLYWYLPKRIDYGLYVYHYADRFYNFNGVLRFRNYGLTGIASRPFNKFTRLDFTLNWVNARLEYFYQFAPPDESVSGILPGIQLVHDTAEWGITGPRDGFRGMVTANVSPKYADNSPEFFTLKTDLRKYIKLNDQYSFAFRLTAGASRGADPQQFFLGGISYWLNYDRDTDVADGSDGRGEVRINSVKDIYFSEFITPLRGARFYERIGNNFVLTNIEFRFPLIPIMRLGFPPITLGNIQGVAFTDIGTAWYNDETLSPIHHDENNALRLRDVVSGYGIGSRIFLFGFLLKYDMAWRYDLVDSSKPIHYLSLGIDF